MSEKIEGTIVMEGLVEGPLPPFPDAQEKLEKWAAGFAGGAVRVNLQVDGSHFSAMPSNEPQQVSRFKMEGVEDADPPRAVTDSLAELLRLFPPLERARVFSTIRSAEYRANVEVQTLYAVGPDGRAATRQQQVPCKTLAAEAPVSPKEMAKRGVTGFLIAAVILLASSLVVDYPGLWRRLTASVEPVKTTVEAGAFEPYLRLEVKGLDRRTGMLLMHVTRRADYPRSEAALDALYENPPASPAPPASAPATTATTAPASGPASMPALSLLRRRLAVASLAKGVIRLEFRDADGHIMGEAVMRVEDLRTVAERDAEAPAPLVNKQPVVPATVSILPE